MMLMWNSVLQLFIVIGLLILNDAAFSTAKLDTGFVGFFTLGPHLCCMQYLGGGGGYCNAFVHTETVLVLKQFSAYAFVIV
jgi:hypothetical protein